MSTQHEPIVPEPVREDQRGYSPEHWDYPRRCADVDAALAAARERVEEWSRDDDPHGWWHERPHWIALYNEVLRLRQFATPDWSGEEIRSTAFSLADTCREALNQEIYGGRAPSDSNALTEVYRTASGTGFTIEMDDGEFGVEVRRRKP